jgi:hypothetical protein
MVMAQVCGCHRADNPDDTPPLLMERRSRTLLAHAQDARLGGRSGDAAARTARPRGSADGFVLG